MPSGAGCPSRPSRSFSLRHTIMITSDASCASPPRRLRLGVARQERRRPKFSPRPGAGAGARAAPGSATATALAMAPATAPAPAPRPAESNSGRPVGAPAVIPRAATIPRVAMARPRPSVMPAPPGRPRPPVVARPPAPSQRAGRRRAPAPGCLGRARGSPPPRAISQATEATALRPPATAPRQAETRAARATVELALTPPPRPRPRPPRRRPTPRPGRRRPPLFAQCPPMPAAAPPVESSAFGKVLDIRDIHGRGLVEWSQRRAGCNPCKKRGRMAGSAGRIMCPCIRDTTPPAAGPPGRGSRAVATAPRRRFAGSRRRCGPRCP